MPHLFAYGTLVREHLMLHLIGRVPASCPATLDDHQALRVIGCDYPGLIPQPGATVEGRLWCDLAETELARLDRYEGDEYRRIAVGVATDKGVQPALTYRFRDRFRDRLTDVIWHRGI